MGDGETSKGFDFGFYEGRKFGKEIDEMDRKIKNKMIEKKEENCLKVKKKSRVKERETSEAEEGKILQLVLT